MEYTNDERINIYKSIFKIFKKYNIIDSSIPTDFVDGLAYARENKMLSIEPMQSNNFLMTYYTEQKSGVVRLIFPTPPYDKEIDDNKLNAFIEDTRNIIDDMMKKAKPKKIILDLRCNNGGYIHVFYNSLYPILPKYDGLILSGVDLDGKELMRLEDKDKKLSLVIDDPINGKITITNDIINPFKYDKIPKIEVLVNSRTASSAEMIMIMYAQRGFKVVGEPTMGLTSGMLTQMFDGYNVHIPYYWFKDLNGKVYNQTTRPKPSKVPQSAKLIEGNVIAKVPEILIKKINNLTPFSTFNHIHCKYLGENSHFGIDYNDKNPQILIINNDEYIYICIPEGCIQPLKEVFDACSNDVLSYKPIIIDIRNSRLKGDDAVLIFSSLFKPYEVPLKKTTNQVDKLGSFYISGTYPYITITRYSSINRYANINAKIWVNKNSISGDCKSTVLLKYLINSFGVIEGSTYGNFFDYSYHKYLIKPYEINIYTCKYK